MAVSIITITIQDAGGRNRTINYHCADTETPADIQTFLTAHLPKLDTVVAGVISSATLTQAMTLPAGLDAVPLNDMLVDDGGLFGFGATGTQYLHSIFVPTVNITFMENDKSIPDATPILEWEQSVLSGEAVLDLTDRYENPLSSFLGGTRRKRK